MPECIFLLRKMISVAASRWLRSTDEGPNLSGITRPRSGGTTRRRQTARERFSLLRRREWGGSSGFRYVEEAWKLKRRHAVDCDLKAFFDTVKHDPLLAQLGEKIGGGNAPAAIAALQESEA